MPKSNKPRLGLFYRSNGRWAGPYCGATFTAYTASTKPFQKEVRLFANYVLKSRVKFAPVG